MSINEKITISDVAEALGISKTTVSRAISGKGRIGEETRSRVLEYIKTHDYRPNPMAKGLANSRSYNIGWVIPSDSNPTELPFFQRCMKGIIDEATGSDYDVLICLVTDDDIDGLERIVRNNKVDGVILGRTLNKDARIEYLIKTGIPFVVIGSSDYDNVIQVDNDHIAACESITRAIANGGVSKFAIIGGSRTHVVTMSRLEGYRQGIIKSGIEYDDSRVYLDVDDRSEVEAAIEAILGTDTECIVCMDDRICYTALDILRNRGIRIPEDIKIASFYHSSLIEGNRPEITSLKYDPIELGSEACRTLLERIDGGMLPGRKLLGYEVMIKDSTADL